MKTTKFILLIGLIVSLDSFGQQLTYKDDLVDTLKISSNLGYYHFDSLGTTTGVYDEYIIVFNKEKNCYLLNPYQRTEYTLTFRPDTSFTKEKILARDLVIKQELISNLLKEFEATSVHPILDNLGINSEDFLKLIGKRRIIQVSKWFDADWYFKRKYSSREENKAFFKGCQNRDTLNLYLSTAFDNGYVIVTDFDEHFEVIITTSKATYRFEGKYPNPFKQPWYNRSRNDISDSDPILNFAINTAIIAILPANFSNLKTLRFDALADKYIEWYLKRRKIII